MQLSVNHFLFSHTTPLQRIATNTTHEWLVTSNFHQFHQHIWPFQLQTRVVNGWLGQIGDWRDVVGKRLIFSLQPSKEKKTLSNLLYFLFAGAPSSFVARSNLVGGFYSGKLIQHCHFVPHEDHGLMAFHELMNSSYDPQPMVPEDAEGDWNTTYSAPEGYQWVKADECTPFYGLSSVDIHDSDTLIYFYFTQFTFEGYCFFGYLPVTSCCLVFGVFLYPFFPCCFRYFVFFVFLCLCFFFFCCCGSLWCTATVTQQQHLLVLDCLGVMKMIGIMW